MRTDLRNHSPTGFDWGYSGSGPSQLALAILAHFLAQVEGQDQEAADNTAQDLYQRFKLAVVVHMDERGW